MADFLCVAYFIQLFAYVVSGSLHVDIPGYACEAS